VTTWQAALTALGIPLLILILAGLGARRRWRRIHALPAYAFVLLAAQVAVLLWPERFYVWRVWLGREAIVGLLGAVIVIEILLRVFTSMPAARQVVLRLLAGAALLTIFALVAVRIPYASAPLGANPWMLALAVDVLPRLAYATMVLCLLALGLTWFYRVPLDPFHRAVMYGFAPYLTLYALTRGITRDAADHDIANAANTAAYVLMLLL
jgi:hypothetical protein